MHACSAFVRDSCVRLRQRRRALPSPRRWGRHGPTFDGVRCVVRSFIVVTAAAAAAAGSIAMMDPRCRAGRAWMRLGPAARLCAARTFVVMIRLRRRCATRNGRSRARRHFARRIRLLRLRLRLWLLLPSRRRERCPPCWARRRIRSSLGSTTIAIGGMLVVFNIVHRWRDTTTGRGTAVCPTLMLLLRRMLLLCICRRDGRLERSHGHCQVVLDFVQVLNPLC